MCCILEAQADHRSTLSRSHLKIRAVRCHHIKLSFAVGRIFLLNRRGFFLFLNCLFNTSFSIHEIHKQRNMILWGHHMSLEKYLLAFSRGTDLQTSTISFQAKKRIKLYHSWPPYEPKSCHLFWHLYCVANSFIWKHSSSTGSPDLNLRFECSSWYKCVEEEWPPAGLLKIF